MNLRSIGWLRAVRGLREGDQGALYTGIGLLLFHYLRSSKPNKQLLYRKRIPIGSTVVVRHGRRGQPRIEILKTESDASGDQTR